MFESLALAAILYASPATAGEGLAVTPPPVVATRADATQTGYAESFYTGRYYDERHEPYRQCLAQREGRFQYWGTGSNGRYQSTYQMTKALVRGAGWMVQPELKRMFGAKVGREIARELRATPGRLWHRFYMDMAFWTVLNKEGTLDGTHHWNGGRFSCTPGMRWYGGDR